MMKRLVCAFVLATMGAIPLLGQSGNLEPDSISTRELLARIEKLEQRVDELQKALMAKQEGADPGGAVRLSPLSVAASAPPAGYPPVAGAAAAQEAPAPAEHAAGQNMAVHQHDTAPPVDTLTEDSGHYPTLGIQGFMDVDFGALGAPVRKSGFDMGQFVLHLSSALSEKVSAFAETSFTATPTGYNLDVERSFIRYDYNDHLKVSFGRFHTPINYWNVTYHHGLWLQTTESRPEMIQFGNSLLPVHFVGALAEGTVPGTGSLNLNYNAGVGNGRGSTISRAGDAGDVNNNRAWFATMFARPDWAYGWQAGASIYRDEIARSGLETNFREWIESAYVVYTKERPEFISEFANIHHRAIGRPEVFNSQAWYAQLAYRLPWYEQKWKPYYRFEYIHIPKSEPVYNGLTWPILGSLTEPMKSYDASIVGVRYDISSFAALKAEYRTLRFSPSEPWVNGAFLQTTFTF